MPAADFHGSSAPFSTVGRSFLSLRRDHSANPMESHRHNLDAEEQRELDAFQHQVADLFNDLADGGDEVLTLAWVCRLLNSFLMCQGDFRAVVLSRRRPPAMIDRLVSDFYERAVKALDVCNAVRDGIEQVRRWRKHIEIILIALGPQNRVLAEGQLRRAKKALGELAILMLDERDAASVVAHRNRSFGRNDGSSSSSSSGNRRSHFRSLSWSVSRSWSAARQLHAIGNNVSAPRGHEVAETAGLAVPVYTMNSVLLFVTWALVAALPCQDRGLQIHLSIPRAYLWASPIMSLYERILEESKKKERKNSIGLLKEIYQTEKCVHHLTDLIDAVQSPMEEEKEKELRQGVQELAQVYETMKEGLDPLERLVREVFFRIVRNRTEGLDCLNVAD